MVLNPHLWAVLKQRYGEVRVFNENIARVEDRRTKSVVEGGESYNVCCPLCGDDRFRLSISYMWLMKSPLSDRRRSELANCYNENCPVRSREFWEPILNDVELAQLGLLEIDLSEAGKVSARTLSRGCIPLPKGCVPLTGLSDDHPSKAFLRERYGFSPRFVNYMAEQYEVQWAEEGDDLFPSAGQRVIFPIRNDRAIIAWQGRAVDPERVPRWFLPPGFSKNFYNGYRVAAHETPILCEGIVNAIACGPAGIAMFGKTLNTLRAEEFAKQWQSVVIATDPDTFVPDNRKGGRGAVIAHEVRNKLARFITDIRMIHWPQDILDLARRHNDGEDVKVPDAADLGPARMQILIQEAR